MAESPQSLLISHLTDAVAMEENVEQMLDGMIRTTEDERIRARLERHRDETRNQAERLRGCLEAHGESSSGLKETVAKAGAAMKGMMDMARGEKAGRNARDAYATEHMEIAAYQLLERVARHAGDERSAEVARRNRAEEEEMARFLDGCWDAAAERSLAEAGAR